MEKMKFPKCKNGIYQKGKRNPGKFEMENWGPYICNCFLVNSFYIIIAVILFIFSFLKFLDIFTHYSHKTLAIMTTLFICDSALVWSNSFESERCIA